MSNTGWHDPGWHAVNPGPGKINGTTWHEANPGNGGGGNGGGGGGKPVSPKRQSIYDMMKQTLQSWGLGDLYHYAVGFLQNGLTSDEVQLRLQDTKEWKQRFAGNEIRQKDGLAVLSPAQYLALEDSYRQVLRQYGVPRGFYDNKKATDNWIGGDVSPSELQSRAQAVSDLVNSNPDVLATYNQFYGGGKGGAIASILDPKAAEPLVQQHVMAAQIGGSAADQGLQVSRARAESFVTAGVTLANARQAYQDIATRLPVDKSIAGRFGDTFGQSQEEDASILGNAGAVQKQNLLYSEEAAQFSGHGAFAAGSNDSGSNF